MDIVDRIFDLLDHKNMEQKKLAELVGVSEDTVSNWRRGKSASYSKFIVQISKALGTSQDYLTTGQGPKEIPPPAPGGDIVKQIEGRYDKETSEAIAMYLRLDAGDRGVIRGRMMQMLEDEKYSGKQELLDA